MKLSGATTWVLSSALAVVSPLAGAQVAEAAGKATTHTYIVVLDQHVAPDAAAARQGRTVGRTPRAIFRHALKGYTMSMTPGEAARVAHEGGVLSVERDRPTHVAGQTLGTGLDRIAAPDTAGAVADPALADGVDDQRVDADLAILDTGVASHPDLDVVARTDCTSGVCKDGLGTDVFGHGTHVAGIAAAIDNGEGVVGVAPGARVWSVKVLGDSGSGTLSALVAGIDWVSAHHGVIDAANVSIECGCVSSAVDNALNQAVAQGVPFAVAAGNSHVDASPYAISGNTSVMTVSALADFDGVSGAAGSSTCRSDQDDTLADFSNWGAAVDIAAPGVCILSTYPNSGYATLSGTSMAAPHVTGAMGLLASLPAYHQDPSAIRQRLLGDANQGWTDDSGDGVQEPLLDISSITPATVPTAPLPQVGVSDPWVVESPAGATAHFRVSVNRPLVGGEYVEVLAKTTNLTATAGKDYTALSSRRIVLTPGNETQTIDVPVLPDSTAEGNETFALDLSTALGGTIADSRGTATIVDPNGPLAMSVGDVTAPEPGTSAPVQVSVTLSAPVPAGQTVTVKVSTANGTATAGSDFTAVSSQLVTFSAGQATKLVPVTLLADGVAEGDETFTVKLATVSGAVLADAASVVTIQDDESPLQISVNDAWVPEGNSGTTPATFTVSLNAAPAAGQSVQVTAKTVNKTASSSSDYVALPSTRLTFGPGVSQQTIAIQLKGDVTQENNETYWVQLSSPAGAVLADSVGVGTIANDDNAAPAPAPVTVSVADARVVEAGFGSSVADVPLTLSRAPGDGESVSVVVQSANGTAQAGSDYPAVPPTTVTFAPGETSHTVSVAALDDSLLEPVESFTLQLSSPVGAVLADPAGVVSVVSDEPLPGLSVGNAWTLEGDSGTTTVQVPVTLSAAPAPGQTVTVQLATTVQTATAGVDFDPVSTQVTFGPGETAAQVPVLVHGDLTSEVNETVGLTLSAPVGATLSDGAGTLTIADEEGP